MFFALRTSLTDILGPGGEQPLLKKTAKCEYRKKDTGLFVIKVPPVESYQNKDTGTVGNSLTFVRKKFDAEIGVFFQPLETRREKVSDANQFAEKRTRSVEVFCFCFTGERIRQFKMSWETLESRVSAFPSSASDLRYHMVRTSDTSYDCGT